MAKYPFTTKYVCTWCLTHPTYNNTSYYCGLCYQLKEQNMMLGWINMIEEHKIKKNTQGDEKHGRKRN